VARFGREVEPGQNARDRRREDFGDSATVDFKDKDSGMAFTFPMVKEAGEWKMAFDKLAGNNRILVGLPEAGGSSGSPAASPAEEPAKDKEEGDGDHSGHEEK
jgi:hypothetical protein